MKRTNSTTDFTKGPVLAAALLVAGVGFTLPVQATDGDEVSVTVAAVEGDVYVSTGQERSTRTTQEPASATPAGTNEAQSGAFADEPKWRQRVFQSN